jgi:hypothetical protein
MTSRKISREEATRFEYTIQSSLDEEVDIISYPYIIKEYDPVGNLVRECTRDRSGGLQELMEYAYDAVGRKIMTRNYYDEDEISETIYITYGDQNQPAKEKRVYADGSESETTFVYNEAGQPVEKRVENDEGEVEEVERWRYIDGLEVWFERREYDEPVFREEQEYDREGRVVVITLWEKDTDQTATHKIFYHDNGTRDRIEKYNNAGQKVAEMAFIRYENDHPAEVKEITNQGSMITRYAYNVQMLPVLVQIYDAREQLINEIVRTYDDDGLLVSIEETTDKQGNGMNLHHRIEYRYEFYE